MTDVVPGGRRRIDRVLDPGYLRGLAALTTVEVRRRREEALAELTDLHRLGHQLDERIAMVTAEQRRRAAANFDAGAPAPTAITRRRRGNHQVSRVFRLRTDPESPPNHRRRRRVERLVADVDLADVQTRTDDELARVLRTFRYERGQVTDASGRVRTVVDWCGDELGSRRVPRDRTRLAGPAARATGTSGSGQGYP